MIFSKTYVEAIRQHLDGLFITNLLYTKFMKFERVEFMLWNEITNKEMSIAQLIRMALKIFKENKKAILMVTFIIFIPINISVALIPLEESVNRLNQVIPQIYTVTDYNYLMNNLSTLIQPLIECYKWLGSIYLIETLFGCIAIMGVGFITYQFIEGNRLDYKFAIEEVFPKWLYAMVTIFCSWVLLIIIYVITAIPIVISPVFVFLSFIALLLFIVYTNFMLYAVVIRGKVGFAALRYSFDMIKGRFWRTVGKLIVIGSIHMAWSMIISSAFINVQSNEIITFIKSCMMIVVSSFFWVVQTIWFLNYEATIKKLENK